MVGQWHANLGVEVHRRSVPEGEYLDRVFKVPLSIYSIGWVGDYPDPDNFLRVALRLHSAWHHKGYSEAIELARRMLDQTKRMELYAQAQRVLAEEVPILPLSYGRLHLLIKPWVKRYPMSAIGGVFWRDVVLEPH